MLLYFILYFLFDYYYFFFGADRHTAGVPFAPGFKECLAYFDRIGVQNWNSVTIPRVWRQIPFIHSGWSSLAFLFLLMVYLMLSLSFVAVFSLFFVQLIGRFVREWISVNFQV